MTLIIWKDGVICADRCITSGALGRPARKLKRIGNAVYAFTGPVDFGASLLAWAERGHDPEKFPPMQSTADYAVLVRARPLALVSEVSLFFQTPEPVVQRDFGATGVGAEFALGVLAAGFGAETAMQHALEHVPSLGYKFGYDSEKFF